MPAPGPSPPGTPPGGAAQDGGSRGSPPAPPRPRCACAARRRPPDGRRGRASGSLLVLSRPGRRFPLAAPPVPHARRAAAAAATAARGALPVRFGAKGKTGSATPAGPPGALACAARPATYALPRLPPPPVPPLRGRAAPAITPRLHGQDNMAPAGAHPEVKGVTLLTLAWYTRAPAAAIFAEGGRAALPVSLAPARSANTALPPSLLRAAPPSLPRAALRAGTAAPGEGGGDALLPGSRGNPAGFTLPPAVV